MLGVLVDQAERVPGRTGLADRDEASLALQSGHRTKKPGDKPQGITLGATHPKQQALSSLILAVSHIGYSLLRVPEWPIIRPSADDLAQAVHTVGHVTRARTGHS